MSSRSDVLSPPGRPQLPSRSGLLKPLAITTPMVFLGEMTIAPRLVLQAIRLLGVDRGRISVPFTTRWRRFASLPALLLQPRTVIAPIALFVGAMITPRLIPQSPSVFWVDDRIECPHHRLQAVGRGGVSDSDRDGAPRPDKANHNRAHIALQRVLGLSHRLGQRSCSRL